eukprot:1373025-Karenia_brevis.AAC.1
MADVLFNVSFKPILRDIDNFIRNSAYDVHVTVDDGDANFSSFADDASDDGVSRTTAYVDDA